MLTLEEIITLSPNILETGIKAYFGSMEELTLNALDGNIKMDVVCINIIAIADKFCIDNNLPLTYCPIIYAQMIAAVFTGLSKFGTDALGIAIEISKAFNQEVIVEKEFNPKWNA